MVFLKYKIKVVYHNQMDKDNNIVERQTKCWYPGKGLVTINTRVKYQSSDTHCSKVISKVKVFKNRSNPRSRSHDKNIGTHGKVL